MSLLNDGHSMRFLTNQYRGCLGYSIVMVCALMLCFLLSCEQKDSGDVSWCIEQASVSAQKIDDDVKRDKAYIEIVRLQLEMGDFSGAYVELGNVQNGEKPWLYNDILRAQAESGDVLGAKAAADLIENATFKALAWEDIAIVEAGLGDVARALETAGLIESETHQANAYCTIVKVQASVGDYAKAADTLGLIVEPNYFRCLAKSYIVEAMTSAKQLEDARAAAESIVNEDCRGRAWGAIAKFQLENGDLAGAEKTAESMKVTVDKVMMFSDIALAYSHQGDSSMAMRLFSEVLATAKELGEEESEINIHRYILKTMLQSGEMDRAMKLAEMTSKRVKRSWYYSDIVYLLIARGDIVRAKSVAERIEESSIKEKVLSTIMLEQVKRVEIAEGKALLATIEDLDLQMQVYCALAEKQASSGDMEGAKATLKQAQEVANGSLSLVVMSRLKIKDVKGAWADARRLPDEERQKKLKAFRMVAAAQAATGDIESIRKWVASQSDAEFITYLYLGAAEGQLEAGSWKLETGKY